MLKLSRVTKEYDGVAVLRGIDLLIPRGRVTVIIGASGSGKSTLIRLANGLILPNQGTVEFMGARVTALTALAFRRRMGYVIQEGGLFPHLTGRGNVALMPGRLGWPSARIDARVIELAELVRLPVEALDRYPSQLSGGERQRVALMRALMLDPEILLLDEPLGALDPLIRYELQTDLKTLFTSLGKTVLMVTHDLGEAGYFADEIVLLREGAIEQRGPVAALIEAPATAYVARFVQAQRSLIDNLTRPPT
ncbi:ATP-binding cassette domain-containing protein [Methylocaldum sp.]|uniref:ATP-binding cassette domain-containing protein n=1 Tax=Methylocaldum sp. TaxID=1969727 RepID=UPI002D4CEB4A|nr:ATP-binding cassette domain-containing protein [Methylocaldum sp.]HYE34742.1 ATP-binding cassette domain-containing protein [Methylocaldum sp.]